MSKKTQSQIWNYRLFSFYLSFAPNMVLCCQGFNYKFKSNFISWETWKTWARTSMSCLYMYIYNTFYKKYKYLPKKMWVLWFLITRLYLTSVWKSRLHWWMGYTSIWVAMPTTDLQAEPIGNVSTLIHNDVIGRSWHCQPWDGITLSLSLDLNPSQFLPWPLPFFRCCWEAECGGCSRMGFNVIRDLLAECFIYRDWSFDRCVY